MRPGRGVAVVLAILAGAVGCHDREPTQRSPGSPASAPAAASDDHEAELAKLRTFEDQRRAAADFAALPSSDQVLGPEPYRIAAHAGGYVGLLRNAAALVALDAGGRELGRLPAPRSPSGLAVAGDDVLVVGDAGHELARYRWTAGQLVDAGRLPIDAIGLRDVVFAPDRMSAYIVEDHDGRLLQLSLRPPLHGPEARELARCHGPIQVAAVASLVAVDCLLDHTIELHRPGLPVAQIHHDGPLWRFAVRAAADGSVLIAAGGVEDHPLEREDGGFGYIDSFVYLYRLAPGAAQPTRLAAINTSALGVVTPKWLALDTHGDAVAITAAGYASPAAITLTWHGDYAAAPAITRHAVLPGTADAQLAADGRLITANALFDAWVTSGDAPRVVPAGPAAGEAAGRTPLSKIGELLFFTTLLTPWNSSDGKLSRFTCETCHHEGYVDGRTHFTGRGHVYATTKPLYGLINNRPYFSRALDKTMTQMVHAEFRVANRHNGRDPWFAVTRAELPWLAQIADAPAELTPTLLRQAFMAFLMDFTHRPNPAADHARFTPAERTGAAVFRDHCASCHAARLNADDPASLVPFERWEALVLSGVGPSIGPIVWSNAAYARTGVEPYVGDQGARVPALRRLYKKWPYFTNGRGRSLPELLDRFAATDDAAYHDLAPATARPLTAEDKAALLAFLDLL